MSGCSVEEIVLIVLQDEVRGSGRRGRILEMVDAGQRFDCKIAEQDADVIGNQCLDQIANDLGNAVNTGK